MRHAPAIAALAALAGPALRPAALVAAALVAAALVVAAALGAGGAARAAGDAVAPGAEAPAFRAALADWLDDDDAAALPALAALAAAGNDAARVLVTLIDRMPETHGPFVAGLTRAERVALMRAPDGRAWIDGAAGELARLWRAAWRADTPPQTAFAFSDIGERRAALTVLLALDARQVPGFAALVEDPRYPPELAYLAWAEAPDAPATAAAVAALPPGDPQAGRLDAAALDDAALSDWLLAAAPAAAIARFCTSTCPAAPGSCALAAYRALGGYRVMLTLGPPSETLIAADAWAGSAKGARALPRRIALRRPPEIGDACLASAVAVTPR